MPHRTFFWFILPTALAMILFIGLPIVSSFFQCVFRSFPFKKKRKKNANTFSANYFRRLFTIFRFFLLKYMNLPNLAQFQLENQNCFYLQYGILHDAHDHDHDQTPLIVL